MLKNAGLWINDKSHHWAHADGRCGDMPASYDPIEDPAIDRARIDAPHTLFYHDANQKLPKWFSSGKVGMIVGNTPWGNKIGNEGDGAEIILNLARQFDTSEEGVAMTMSLLVGKPCFSDLVVQGEQDEWELNREPKYDALRGWSLLYHAEVGTTKKGCVLMILVKKRFAEGKGKIYERLNFSSY